MSFWYFMFAMTLLIPTSLLLIWKLCPALNKINGAMGYRSLLSTKNKDTWEFAQKECAKISFKLFFPTFLLAVAVMPFYLHSKTDTIGWVGFAVTMLQMISFIIIVYNTETKLKKQFDENGLPKQSEY